MSSNPEQVTADLEVTRAELSRDVGALAQAVRPANVAARQKEKIASAIFGAKDKAGSAAHGARDAVMGQASSLSQSSTGEVLHSTGDAISSAPQAARQGTEGNPLAAGLIAFGCGWLAGSVLPPSRAERRAAGTLKEKAAPLVQEVSDMAKDTAHSLEEPAREGLEKVRSTGAEAVQSVKDEAGETASEVADTARERAQGLKGRGG